MEIQARSSSTFAGNVLKLATVSFLLQGFGIIITPILARLFAPETFGIAATFSSINGIIGIVVCLRYELSIVLPKTDEEAANLFGISLFFVLIITSLISLTVIFLGDVILKFLSFQELIQYLPLIPLAVFLNGVMLALNQWNSRKKHFGRISVARVFSYIAAQGTKLCAGIGGYVSGGVLIGATIFGQLVSASVLGSNIWKKDIKLIKSSVRLQKMLRGLKRYRKFPIFGTWSALLNSTSRQLPFLILAHFFSASIVGYYAMSVALLGLPINLIGQALSQVFYQRAAQAYQQRELKNVVENIFKRLISVGILPFFMLCIMGKEFFILILGANWVPTGNYIQILSCLYFLIFISSSLGSLYNILGKQQEALVINIIRFSTQSGALIYGGLIGRVEISLLLFTICGVIVRYFSISWIMNQISFTYRKNILCVLKSIIVSSPFAAIIVLLKYSIGSYHWLTLTSSICCTIIYYVIIMLNDKYVNKYVLKWFNCD